MPTMPPEAMQHKPVVPAPQPNPVLSDGDARPTEQVLDVAAKIARGRKETLSTEEQADALDWFLADSDDEDDTHSFQINVGTMKHKKWVTWTVRPVDPDKLRRIRRASAGNRMTRRAGNNEFDEVAANIAIVVEGTVYPDIRAAAKEKGMVAPEEWVRIRFRRRPGLLTQIAAEVMSCSGYDEDDIREADAAQG
jgi:hypothetical protein